MVLRMLSGSDRRCGDLPPDDRRSDLQPFSQLGAHPQKWFQHRLVLARRGLTAVEVADDERGDRFAVAQQDGRNDVGDADQVAAGSHDMTVAADRPQLGVDHGAVGRDPHQAEAFRQQALAPVLRLKGNTNLR